MTQQYYLLFGIFILIYMQISVLNQEQETICLKS